MHLSKFWLRRYSAKLSMLFIGLLVPLYLFGSLAEDVAEHDAFLFDRTILLFAHSHASPVLDAIMVFFTRMGSSFVLVPVDVIILFMLIRQGRRAASAFWVIAIVGTVLLNLFAKHAFARTRPDLWISILPETTFSFPSGHAMNSMAMAATLAVIAWRTRWRREALALLSLFVFMVGLSRVYLGVHYPSDILAGWAAAVAWVLGLNLVFRNHLGNTVGVTK
jgi:membrane-associated phospholipid phosphatase